MRTISRRWLFLAGLAALGLGGAVQAAPRAAVLDYWLDAESGDGAGATAVVKVATEGDPGFQLDQWTYADCLFVYSPRLGCRGCSHCQTSSGECTECTKLSDLQGHGNACCDCVASVEPFCDQRGAGLLVHFSGTNAVNRFGIGMFTVQEGQRFVTGVRIPPAAVTNDEDLDQDGRVGLGGEMGFWRIPLHYTTPASVQKYILAFAAHTPELFGSTIVFPSGESIEVPQPDPKKTATLPKLAIADLVDSDARATWYLSHLDDLRAHSSAEFKDFYGYDLKDFKTAMEQVGVEAYQGTLPPITSDHVVSQQAALDWLSDNGADLKPLFDWYASQGSSAKDPKKAAKWAAIHFSGHYGVGFSDLVDFAYADLEVPALSDALLGDPDKARAEARRWVQSHYDITNEFDEVWRLGTPVAADFLFSRRNAGKTWTEFRRNTLKALENVRLPRAIWNLSAKLQESDADLAKSILESDSEFIKEAENACELSLGTLDKFLIEFTGQGLEGLRKLADGAKASAPKGGTRGDMSFAAAPGEQPHLFEENPKKRDGDSEPEAPKFNGGSAPPLLIRTAKAPPNVVPKLVSSPGSTKEAEADDDFDLSSVTPQNVIIFQGNESGAKKLREMLRVLDYAPRRIKLRVHICELRNGGQSELGIDAGPNNVNAKFVEQSGAKGGFEVFSLGDFTRKDGLGFDAVLGTLVKQGKAKVLAEPNLTTVEDQVAEYKAVRKIPYSKGKTSDADNNLFITEEIDYQDIGITLKFLPRLGHGDTLTIDVRPTISSLLNATAEGGNSVDATGALVAPAYFERDLKSKVSVRNGEPFVIAGMIDERMQVDVDKVPLLSEIPLLGELFKKRRKNIDRSEVCIIVIPEIMDDLSCQDGGES